MDTRPAYIEKRARYAQQIRRKQKQRYITFQREKNYGEIPLSVYVPALIDQQAYEELQQVLDGLIIEQQQYIQYIPETKRDTTEKSGPLPKQTIRIIFQRYQNHNQFKVRILMLKLMNRMNLWSEAEQQKALSLLQDAKINGKWTLAEQMIKQLAINLQRIKKFSSTSNEKQYEEKLKATFRVIKDMKLVTQSYQIFWMDIMNDGLTIFGSNRTMYEQILKDIEFNDAFFNNLDIKAENQSNLQFKFVRFINIFDQILAIHENSEESTNIVEKITTLPCFSQFIRLLTEGSIDIVMQGLSLLAQMYNASDLVIKRCLMKFDSCKIHTMYLNHILEEIRVNNLWAISNILGSQWSQILLNYDSGLLGKLTGMFESQKKPRLVIEISTCLLNLWCVYSQHNFLVLFKDEKKCENYIEIMEKIGELLPNYQHQLLQRYIYAVYTLIQNTNQIKQSLSQLSSMQCSNLDLILGKLPELKKMIGQFYYNFKGDINQTGLLQKLDTILQMLQH